MKAIPTSAYFVSAAAALAFTSTGAEASARPSATPVASSKKAPLDRPSVNPDWLDCAYTLVAADGSKIGWVSNSAYVARKDAKHDDMAGGRLPTDVDSFSTMVGQFEIGDYRVMAVAEIFFRKDVTTGRQKTNFGLVLSSNKTGESAGQGIKPSDDPSLVWTKVPLEFGRPKLDPSDLAGEATLSTGERLTVSCNR